MDYFLIVILSVVVFSVWQSGREAVERLRDELKILEREIGWLRDELAALVKARTAAPAGVAEPSPVKVAAPAPMPVAPVSSQIKPPEPASQHTVPATFADFTPPARAMSSVAPAPLAPPVKPLEPVATPVAPASLPAKPPEPAAQYAVPAAIATLTPPAKPPISAPPPTVPSTAGPVRVRAATSVPLAALASNQEPKPQATTPPAEPVTEYLPPAAKVFSLEERLGTNWLNKLGIASLVIGLAFFLAVKLQTWGPAGKVLCGYAVSFALLAGGVWLERKPTYRIFARAGIGGGWALTFFTTFALYHVPAAHVLDSLAIDLVLMLGVAAGMVAHSLRYRSQTVTGLAFMLGYATLLASHMESSDGAVVFSLTASAVLAVALVVVTTLRHWAVLELAGLAAVYLTHFVWLTRVLPEDHAAFTAFWPSTALILLYWLIFRLAYVLRTPLDKHEEDLSSLTAVLNSTGVLGLLKFQSAHPEWAFWALAALGTIEMALAFYVRSRRRQAFVVLTTIATILLVSAVPFRFHGVSWPVLWLVEAQVLAICGLRLGEPVFRRLGLLAGVITGGVLAVKDVVPLLLFRLDNPDTSRHLSLTAGLALAAILYWIHSEVYPRRWPQIAENDGEAFALRVTSWLAIAAAATALWVVLPDLWFPVGWLALVLLLGFASRRFAAARLAHEADVLALGTGVVLVFHHVLPLVLFRLDYPDPSRHPAETAVLTIAALCYWIYAELYPRVLRTLSSGLEAETNSALDLNVAAWQEFMLPMASLLGTAMAAAALWVALPDIWLPVGWLALVLMLGLTARRLAGLRLALQADVLALGAAVVLVFHHILPLILFRLDSPDPSRHPTETGVLALAALCYWVYAEVYPRTLRSFSAGLNAETGSALYLNLAAWQAFALPMASLLGTAMAAAALWVALPAPWIVVGWLALVLLLGLAADWVKSGRLALQADLLAVAAIIGLFFWNLWTSGRWDHQAPLIAAVALLYAGMRRKTPPARTAHYVAPMYSWAATLLLAFTAADLSSEPLLIPVWAALGLSLFEIGRIFRKGFLRWQGYFLLALAFGRYLFIDLWSGGPAAPIVLSPNGLLLDNQVPFSLVKSLLLEVLILAAVAYWLTERTRNPERCARQEHLVGLAAGGLGTLSIALWFAYRFPSVWVPVPGGEAWVTAIWSGMATILLALAWLVRRKALLVHAIALVVAVLARGFFVDLFADSPAGFWSGPLFHLGLAAVILLAALPFAFRLRREGFFANSILKPPADLDLLFRSPEQIFFFSPLALEVVALAVKLSSGHITIAWSLLGLGVFLFALAVGERSYRLAGLGLLLVSVAKILLMDVWQLSSSDRYTTLIVLGLALLAVSFLYTRFGAVIRRYL